MKKFIIQYIDNNGEEQIATTAHLATVIGNAALCITQGYQFQFHEEILQEQEVNNEQ